MKLAISNIGWDPKHDFEMLETIYKLGFEGIEVAPTRLISVNPYEYLEKANIIAKQWKERYKLEICSMQSIWYGKSEKLFGSSDERKTLFNYTKQAILFAEQMQCHNIVFGCPVNRNIDNFYQVETAVSFFQDIGDFAFQHNTVLALEANPKVYNTNFINTTEEALAFALQVNRPGFLVNLDIGTMIQNSENPDILTKTPHLINHVHLSEPFLSIIKERTLHEQLFKLLEENGYKGYLSIEMKKQESICDVIKAMKYLKKYRMLEEVE